MFDVNEHGLQTVTYDPDKPALNLPTDQMETNRLQATRLRDEISIANPQFTTLSSATQTEVLAAALYVSTERLIADSKNMTKALSGSDVSSCQQKAKTSMVLTVTGLTAAYIASAALCGGTFFAVIACEALVYTGYISASATVIDLYKSRTRLCELQGYY